LLADAVLDAQLTPDEPVELSGRNACQAPDLHPAEFATTEQFVHDCSPTPKHVRNLIDVEQPAGVKGRLGARVGVDAWFHGRSY